MGVVSRLSEVRLKPYEAPVLRKITSEQAKLICVPYAWIGHKGAKVLLEILFAVPQERRGRLDRKQGCEREGLTMTEAQILDRIRTMTNPAELDSQLGEVHQMQDYLNALRSGEMQAHGEWPNSSQLLFPEDFTDEMNELSSEPAMSDQLLKQLDRIEAALEERKKEVVRG
jgi:hypothetical protein